MKIILLSILFSFLFLSSTLQAKTFDYWAVHNMPKSIEKDYYIWRFLSQKTTTKAEARRIIYEASRLNKKLRTAYRKKTGLNVELPKLKQQGQWIIVGEKEVKPIKALNMVLRFLNKKNLNRLQTTLMMHVKIIQKDMILTNLFFGST